MNANRTGAAGRLGHREMTKQLLSVFHGVHNELGSGFPESVYTQKAVAVALEQSDVTFDREPHLAVRFPGQVVRAFRPGFVVVNAVVVDVKAARAIDEAHHAQLPTYLRATTLEIGLLLNFGPSLSFNRTIFSNTNKIRVNPCSSVVQ